MSCTMGVSSKKFMRLLSVTANALDHDTPNTELEGAKKMAVYALLIRGMGRKAIIYEETSGHAHEVEVHPDFLNEAHELIIGGIFDNDPVTHIMSSWTKKSESIAMYGVKLSGASLWAVTSTTLSWVTFKRNLASCFRKSLDYIVPCDPAMTLLQFEAYVVRWPEILEMTMSCSCGHCGVEARSVCQGKACQQRYCSRACQVSDWTRHKPQCCQDGRRKKGFDIESMLEFLSFCAKEDNADTFCKQQLDKVATVFA